MDGTNTALIAASTGMGISGAAILSTIVAILITVGLEIGAVVCAVGGVISNFISKRLLVKARKHDLIRVLCMSKLNTISNLLSDALIDGKISDEEFKMVIYEIGKFHLMKTDKRASTAKAYKK